MFVFGIKSTLTVGFLESSSLDDLIRNDKLKVSEYSTNVRGCSYIVTSLNMRRANIYIKRSKLLILNVNKQ